MPEFRTAEYPGASDSVNAVIDCFGPADLCAVLELPESERRAETESLFTLFCGGTLDQDLLKKMSPIRYVTELYLCGRRRTRRQLLESGASRYF